MKACRWCVVLLWSLALPALAADDLAAIRDRIDADAVLRGGFEQEKRLAGFRQPLRSKGRFVLAREHGILWDTQAPFPSLVVFAGDRILARAPDGGLRVEVDASGRPGMASANALVFALIAGDLDTLSAQFDARGALAEDGSWTLRLVPRAGPLSAALNGVRLEGDRHVRMVELEEAGGDVSLVRFLDIVPASTLDDAEQALFGAALD